MDKKITIGHTNQSFQKDGLFYQIKNKNEFNHISDYEQLKNFNFVPKLIKNDQDTLTWEWIEGKHLDNPNADDLKQLANILLEIHSSNIKLAKFNVKKRIDAYRKIMKRKQIKIEIIDLLYRKINNILKNMDKSIPLHSDLYHTNILKTKDDKLFIIDWEYSHMGDIHFELAYIIEAYALDEKKEKIFLEAYKNYDPYLLKKHKVLVNYLTVLWLYSNDTLYFSPDFCLSRLEKYYKEGF